MGTTTERSKRPYTATSIETELVEQIRKYVKPAPRFRYSSLMDFLKDAIRRRLEDLESDSRSGGRSPSRQAAGPAKFCHNCGAELKGPFCSQCGTKA